MATIDLGKLGFVNKGTYNNSTTYEKNDLVQFTDGGILSTYLYIDSTAQSGQAPSSSGTAGSRWVYYAKGGAAGTDVGTTLTTQGDILYRDGSGLQRLPKGTANQVLKMNSGATAPEYGTISSDFVKLTSTHTTSGSASSINYQNIFDDTVYGGYMINWNVKRSTSSGGMKARFLNGSTAYSGSTNYRRIGYHAYRRTDQNENSLVANNDADGLDHITIEGWGNNTSYNTFGNMFISGNLNENTNFPLKIVRNEVMGRDDSNPNYVFADSYSTMFDGGNVNGIQFFANSTINVASITIWGMKK